MTSRLSVKNLDGSNRTASDLLQNIQRLGPYRITSRDLLLTPLSIRMDATSETLNTHQCRWRFCSSTFPTVEAVSLIKPAHAAASRLTDVESLRTAQSTLGGPCEGDGTRHRVGKVSKSPS